MSWIAAATIGGALIGGVASNSAADKAEKGQKNALASSQAGTAQARTDINRLFGDAAEQQRGGFQGAIDFLADRLPQQIEPFQQGNVAAQEQLARGLSQQQNALMGSPVDLSGFQARQFGVPQLDPSQLGPQPTPAPVFDSGAPSESAANPLAIGGLGPQGIGGIGTPAGNFFGGGMPANNVFGAGIPSRDIFGGIRTQPDAFIQNDQRLF